MSEFLHAGPLKVAEGVPTPATANPNGATRISNADEFLTEITRQGRMFAFGISDTALVNENAIATGLTATAKPIIAVWNPVTSKKNLVIVRATIVQTTIAATAVSPAGFHWVYSRGNGVITTGSDPINLRDLRATPGVSGCKVFACSTALTGLTTSLAYLMGTSIDTINAAGPATAISQAVGSTEELPRGTLICPPGGVLGIMCQAATTTVSVSTGLIFYEQDIAEF